MCQLKLLLTLCEMNAKFELAVIADRELTIISESEWPRSKTRTSSAQIFVDKKSIHHRLFQKWLLALAHSILPYDIVLVGSFGPKHIQSPDGFFLNFSPN